MPKAPPVSRSEPCSAEMSRPSGGALPETMSARTVPSVQFQAACRPLPSHRQPVSRQVSESTC